MLPKEISSFDIWRETTMNIECCTLTEADLDEVAGGTGFGPDGWVYCTNYPGGAGLYPGDSCEPVHTLGNCIMDAINKVISARNKAP